MPHCPPPPFTQFFHSRTHLQTQGGSKNNSDYSPGNETGVQDYVDKMGNANPQCLISSLIKSDIGWYWYVNPVMYMDPPLFCSSLLSIFSTPSISSITRGNPNLWEWFYWRYRYLIDLNAQEPKPDSEQVAQLRFPSKPHSRVFQMRTGPQQLYCLQIFWMISSPNEPGFFWLITELIRHTRYDN